MALRKEQVLVLASLAVGVLVWKSSGGAEWRVPQLTTSRLEFTAGKVPTAPVVTTDGQELSLRRWFREPSETQPLPPRDLPFPGREPMPWIALPLDPGPDLARADLLSVSGVVVTGVTLQSTAAATGSDPAPEQPAVRETLDDKKKRYAKIYDQVNVANQAEPFFGILRAPGQDLYRLEELSDFDEVVVHMLQFSLSKEKLVPPELTFGGEAMKIAKVRLADSLRNTVGRMVRAVPEGAAHASEREHLIDDLLLLARQDGSVFQEVLHQVDLLEQGSAGLLAARTRARVLFAKGDFDAEFAVYQAIRDADGPAAAFRHEGLGNLEARLGLTAAAERDLRRAVELQPTDARPHASLAAFLRRRGQPQAAVGAARRALETLGSVADAADRQRIVPVIVACMLGVGDLDGARLALQGGSFGSGREADALGSFLRASTEYTAGKLVEAKDGFRTAAAAGYGGAAQLGVAACQVRLGEWQEALAGFEAVADQAPLLRHRALTGLSLLYLRIGQYDNAIANADRALEASPQDAYAHYLRARAQAAQGQLAPALESLQQVLRLRDDFVPAVAAVAELHMRLFHEGDPGEQASHALAARSYADRAVSLSPVTQVPLYEQQAIAHFHAADLRGAAAAFAQARDAAADDAGRLFAAAGLAIVDYAMDHVDDARPQLEHLQEGLAKDHPMRQWAAATLLMIDDHAQMEQLDDHFERDEMGSIWPVTLNGNAGVDVAIRDHHLVFGGRFTKAGTEVMVARNGAVQKAGKFLAAGCRLQVGAQHQGDSFAGLRIRTRGSSAEFSAQIGVRDNRLFWLIHEGKDEPLQVPGGAEVIAAGEHAFALRVEDRGDNLFRLALLFDGLVVQKKDLTMLRLSDTSRELETALLVVAGSRPGSVDARFDDFHLERRKD